MKLAYKEEHKAGTDEAKQFVGQSGKIEDCRLKVLEPIGFQLEGKGGHRPDGAQPTIREAIELTNEA